MGNMKQTEKFYTRMGFSVHTRSNVELTGKCPLCSDAKHFNIQATTGLWHCFKCGTGGNPWQFLDRMGVEKKERFDILKEYGFELTNGQQYQKSTIQHDYEKSLRTINKKRFKRLKKRRSYNKKAIKLMKSNGIGFLKKNYIIPLFNPNGEIVGLQRYNPRGVVRYDGSRLTNREGKRIKAANYAKKQGHSSGFFGLKKTIVNKRSGIHTYVICESPFNALALQINMGFDGSNGILAIGHCGQGNLPKNHKTLFKDKTVYFIYDWDFAGHDGEPGQNGVMVDAKKIKKYAKEIFNVIPDEEIRKDFKDEGYGKVDLTEDFFNKEERSVEEFRKLFDNPIQIELKESDITLEFSKGDSKPDYIQKIRKVKIAELHAFEKKKLIADFIIKDMKDTGRFFKTTMDKYYWFNDQPTTLYQISDGDENLSAFIEREFGLNSTEVEYKYLIAALKAQAINYGAITDVRQFSFYNDNCLYVSNNKEMIYKLDGKTVSKVPNGTDGVFFLTEKLFEGFEYIEDYEECFHDLIVDAINFASGEKVNINKTEQKKLFTLWFYSLFFESLLPTKPIQVCIGVKGSGKTSSQKGVGLLLFGKDFNVSSITNEQDFDATISNSYLVCFDNVDGKIKWLNDRLARCATGQMIQKRKYYTENDKVFFIPKCFLSLNARTPNFRRDDVCDRLLIFKVERHDDFEAQSRLQKRILEKRNDLWSEVLDELNLIVEHLKHDTREFKSQFRMADFAELAWKINDVIYQDEKNFLKLLKKISSEQSEFLLEDNQIFQFLSLWIDTEVVRRVGKPKKPNVGREVTASLLFKEFKNISIEEEIPFDYESPISFGKHLKNLVEDLRNYFKIESNTRNNLAHYRFKKKKNLNKKK